MKTGYAVVFFLFSGCATTSRPTLSTCRRVLPEFPPNVPILQVCKALSLPPPEITAAAETRPGISRYDYALMPKGTLEVWVYDGSLSQTKQSLFVAATLVYTDSAGQTITENYPSPTLERSLRELPRIAKGTPRQIVFERLHLCPDVELWSLNHGHSTYNVDPQGELKLIIDYNPVSPTHEIKGRFFSATLTYTNDAGVSVTEEYPK